LSEKELQKCCYRIFDPMIAHIDSSTNRVSSDTHGEEDAYSNGNDFFHDAEEQTCWLLSLGIEVLHTITRSITESHSMFAFIAVRNIVENTKFCRALESFIILHDSVVYEKKQKNNHRHGLFRLQSARA
jgi:hypothetical protein